MSEFKIPDSIPQDLLLIQEIMGLPEPPRSTPVTREKDDEVSSDSEDSEDISSSSSEDENSEEEVEANLVVDSEGDSELASPKSGSVPSSSDSESDSDSEEDPKNSGVAPVVDADVDEDDDEDAVPSTGAGPFLHTKHEIVEADITVPDIEKVGPDEHLKKVGDIMSIIGQVAIVRGLPSHNMARGSQKALDSDTLLVFDDRTVMGYIYETFGPTNQPLYQIKFSSKYPLNPERVKVSREVFIVPSKSKFVFIDQIKALKGSDASNVYDEEPADDELEFSDDEAEAAHKSRMKRKRGESRSRSITREPTPNPSHMRDQELVDDMFLSRSAYDEHGPYDLGSIAPGPSRPAPIPYDDAYATTVDHSVDDKATSFPRPTRPPARQDGRQRGRGRAQFGQHIRGRGRGGFDYRRGGAQASLPRQSEFSEILPDSYDPRAVSQTQMMGQNYYQRDFSSLGMVANPAGSDWGYSPGQWSGMVHPQFGGQNAFFHSQAPNMSFVQPHINPRFAPSFGLNMGQTPALGGQFGMAGAGAPSGSVTDYPDPDHQQPWSQWGPPDDGQQG